MKRYRNLTKKEEEQAIIKIMDTLLDPSLPYSGKHRKEQWEKGWGENLKSGDLKPKYFGKHLIQRLNGKFVMAKSKKFEVDQLHNLVSDLSSKYFKSIPTIVEFGCGTGHNLLQIKKIYPHADYWGGDWVKSSNKMVDKLGMNGFRFNFFEPEFTLAKDLTGVLTVAALEQTGTNYKKFVLHLLKNKPSIVVHIEPIPELLDPTNLLDYLSIKYMEKRKYLSGYLTYLQDLEKKGKIKILEARRSGIGSFYIDGYSIIVWKPL